MGAALISKAGDGPTASREWRLALPEINLRARRLTGDRDGADDLAGGVLLQLVRWRDRVVTLYAWSWEVLRHLAAQARGGDRYEVEMDEKKNAETPKLAPPRAELAVLVHEVLSELRVGQRRLLLLYAQGRTHREMAEAIGCAVHQVRPRIARAQRSERRIAERKPKKPRDPGV